MAFARSNRLLPILGSGVLLMAVLVGFKSCTGDHGGLRGLLDRIPQAPAPDADTPAETIRTLTARVADMTAEMKALREENAALVRHDQELRQSLKRDIEPEIDIQTSTAAYWVSGRWKKEVIR
jgi:hypothetical protein